MITRARIRALLLALDSLIARCSLAMRTEQGLLLSFLFHGLYEETGRSSSARQIPEPQPGITVEMFRRFVSHFQDRSYTFVSLADITKGLRPGGKYVFVTFDDGYYNNVRAIPVLENFDVPALLCPSIGHIKHGKAFWWNVVDREMQRRGRPAKEVRQLFGALLQLKAADVEARVREHFGGAALNCENDVDRPFTPSELRDFANHPLITLGNHTSDHAILTNYSAAEIRAQIQSAQDDIRLMTGKSPEIIAYPNGNESHEIVEAAKSVGLRLGLGVTPGWNRLPVRPGSRDAMRMKRFALYCERPIEPQCAMSRSEFSIYRFAQNIKLKAYGDLSTAASLSSRSFSAFRSSESESL
jgi:peptidoglycan/xylan/chitin deacetylase (PgdA/CDA1 family)